MLTFDEWQNRSEALSPDLRSVIGGERVQSESETTVDRVSPADGRVLHALPAGSAEDAARAVRAARASFEQGSWSQMSPLFRKSILFGFAGRIDSHSEELALLDSVEMGKPISKALVDVMVCGQMVRYFAEYADKALSSVGPTAPSLIQYGRREPRGVVGAIVAWNYPLPNAALKLGPALAAGNSVVLKPSEFSPSSALRLAELAVEAGIPPGVLNVLAGAGRTVGAALAEHPDVDFLAFTGSSGTGRELMRLAAKSGFKPLQLECGGKSANVVFADCADLDAVAQDAAQRIFENQGQLCVAGTRLIAHESIKSELVERIVDQAKRLNIGDPLDPATTFGPLVSQARMDAVLNHCTAGAAAGAELRHGGGKVADMGSGFFVEPTVFDKVAPDSALAQEDIFGPVLSVMTFKSADEAVALANATPYGLSATVWTTDLSTAGEMTHRLKAGRVTVLAAPPNPMHFSFPLAAEPIGHSGYGSEGGREGFELFTRVKAVELYV